jgi:hypothetical protein
MLAYGMSGDATDEYCKLGASTAIKAIKRFVIVHIQSNQFIRIYNAR